MSKKKNKVKNEVEKKRQAKDFIIPALVCIGIAVALYFLVKEFQKTDQNASTEPASSTQPANNKTQTQVSLKKISSGSVKIPVEVFTGKASRALPMTAEARNLIHKKYQPDMIGVPQVGEPFRLNLPHPIKPEILDEIMQATLTNDSEYEDILFIQTTVPDVVFGIVTRISGEMVDYCDSKEATCTPINVFLYNGFLKQEL